MIDLPRTTDCLQAYTGPCAAPWLWRAPAQVLYRFQDWQTVARTVTDRVDHPYAKLVALMLHAQGGDVAGAPALLRRTWQRIDPNASLPPRKCVGRWRAPPEETLES